MTGKNRRGTNCLSDILLIWLGAAVSVGIVHFNYGRDSTSPFQFLNGKIAAKEISVSDGNQHNL